MNCPRGLSRHTYKAATQGPVWGPLRFWCSQLSVRQELRLGHVKHGSWRGIGSGDHSRWQSIHARQYIPVCGCQASWLKRAPGRFQFHSCWASRPSSVEKPCHPFRRSLKSVCHPVLFGYNNISPVLAHTCTACKLRASEQIAPAAHVLLQRAVACGDRRERYAKRRSNHP